MKARKSWFLFAALLSLTVSITVPGQKGSPQGVTKTDVSAKREFSFEAAAEKLIRAAYAKVTRYNKAFLLVDDRHNPSRPIEEAYLRFELSNFKAGPIQEILNLPHGEVKTITQEEIDLIRVVTTLNDADPHVAYSTNWHTAQYASGYDPKWTINDMLSHDPASYHDIGGYATYDVVLRLHGKVRTYRALTLFHNPYGSVEKLKPSFWDSMVGSAGAMQDLWYERRPAVGEPGGNETVQPAEKSVSLRQSRTSMAGYPKLEEGSSSFSRITPRVTTETSSDTPSLGPVVQGRTEDQTEHSSGAHGESIDFQGSCEAPNTSQQICRVNFHFIYVYENGTLTNRFYSHKNRYDYILGSHSGSRGTPISCYSGHGIATKNCFGDCYFTATLVGSGLSMQMTGGDVWRGQAVHGHTCNIPKPRPGGGGGGGVCNEAAVKIVAASARIPAPNLINPYCCDAVEQANCFNGGGEWSDSTCSCYSPIIVDVAGDGFNLTNAIDGVMFDLNATGTPEQISWTAADSDDALLVLDRNGNSVIDNGRELFGSSSPQAYLAAGETKNGFRALAMFDDREHGGNGDGQIDSRDGVFSSLKLWRDGNHNGISEAGELRNLTNSDVRVIELRYREARRQDENGNWFRYRAKVNDAQGGQTGRWAWDVFLQKPH